MGALSMWSARNKMSAETGKALAETESIHAQVADRWAEHVSELQNEVKGLRLDISQVRRENESYRKELLERDMAIIDLKDWAYRLVKQLSVHAPEVEPEQYRHVQVGEETLRRLRKRVTVELPPQGFEGPQP